MSDDWLTPLEIIDALGPFDLDPCNRPANRGETATNSFTPAEDGLSQTWSGRVWLHPPYPKDIDKWVGKMADHGNGVCLTYVATNEPWFQEHVFGHAYGILFIKGKLRLHRGNYDTVGAEESRPMCLIAYSAADFTALEQSGIAGYLKQC